MGYRRQFALYGYYLFCAQLLRLTSPPLAAMTAQETALGGAFRAAHQRLVANAEEVAVSAAPDGGRACCLLHGWLQKLQSRGCSWVQVLDIIHPPAHPCLHLQFNDPPAGLSEQMILNQHLYRMLRHSRLSAFQQFVQQILDGFFVKVGQGGSLHRWRNTCASNYACPSRPRWLLCDAAASSPAASSPAVLLLLLLQYGATLIALAIYSAPLYWRSNKLRSKGGAAAATAGAVAAVGMGALTQDYISSMRLLSNTSKGIGDLVLVYKRVTGLAGHTSRVSELLERIAGLSSADEEGEWGKGGWLGGQPPWDQGG